MANTQPIAEAVIKVKLDPASLDFVRGQLKGLNNAANVSGISGASGSGSGVGSSAISQALAAGIGSRIGGGSIINKENNKKFATPAIDKLIKNFEESVDKANKRITITPEMKGSHNVEDRKKTMEDIGDLVRPAAKELEKIKAQEQELTKEQIKQSKELKKQEGQLRTNLSLAKTHLDTIAKTIKYLAAPIAGLGILGFRKYLETLDAGAINLRKAIGGLTYSWNQFLARVGDTINKSYGLQKIIQNISKILDNMDEKKIKMLFDVGIALSFLFVVTKIATAVVTIGRMLSTMRTAMSTFSLAGTFKGPAAGGAAGAVEGATGAAGGATTGGMLSGIGTALLKFGKIALEVTGIILLLARIMGVEGKSSTEVLINVFKILWEALKWVGDFVLKLTQDIISAFELIGNIFITIGDSINFLANKWNELFAGGPTDSLEKFKAKLSDVWGNWINQVNSTGFGAKKQEEEKKKYVFGGTTTTSTFAGLNKIAQDLADNTMLMAADKMDQAADKMNSAVDKLNSQWSDYGPANQPLIFNPSFATF